MSGHSKWSTIKHKKGKADAQRGKIYTKLGRELAIAVKEGGGNPEANGKLRDVIAKCKTQNMPGDSISRAIKKAAGELGNINYDEILYEGYAAGGTAVLVEVLTDNRNRSSSDVRHIFDKFGAGMGATGCVSYMFEKKGIMIVEDSSAIAEDTLMMDALDAGAQDFQAEQGYYEITAAPTDFSAVREAIEKKGYTFASAALERVPQTTVIPKDEETTEKILKFLEEMEDLDDVQSVFHNAELPQDEEE